MQVRRILSAVLILPALVAAAPPTRVVAASGAWAALSRGGICEAASAALRPPQKDRPQARASLSFDGRRQGQFAARLSRPPRSGAAIMLHVGDSPFLLVSRGDRAWSNGTAQDLAIIAAIRGASGMRVEARSPGGGRIIDRYELAGAPTAIDAAAACSAALLQKARFQP